MFAVFSILVLLFPYSGDDWAWGSEIGLDRLETRFESYNGRYAGNLLVLILTRSNILRIFVISASLMSICIFPRLFSKSKSLLGVAFTAVLLYPFSYNP
ncbi:MAG: hypothetical protein E7575_07010 [Ruminococcaceae bacterium]|nr:hypothetical protein [Oscillospiraceae bacterium]